MPLEGILWAPKYRHLKTIMKISMILGPMVRGVHEDPRRHGSTGTPSHFIGIEDINNDHIVGMDNEFVPIAGIDNPKMICDQTFHWSNGPWGT